MQECEMFIRREVNLFLLILSELIRCCIVYWKSNLFTVILQEIEVYSQREALLSCAAASYRCSCFIVKSVEPGFDMYHISVIFLLIYNAFYCSYIFQVAYII